MEVRHRLLHQVRYLAQVTIHVHPTNASLLFLDNVVSLSVHFLHAPRSLSCCHTKREGQKE